MNGGNLIRVVKRNRVLVENFSYITLLQVFVLLAPLLTYPYLTRVLGHELYGYVITAQVLSSYFTILVRFGFDSVSARYISIYREDKDKLSEIMSSILSFRLLLWLVGFALYVCVVLMISNYRQHFWLFIFSYGLTFNVLLFPQFYFQGIEKMKFITLINVLIQAVFVVLTFVVIKSKGEYIYVPLLHTAGYFLGGGLALFIIFNKHGLKFKIPSKNLLLFYVKDALPLFSTDAICTIKDKLNYLLLGFCAGMENVISYDIGAKLTNLIIQPLTIIGTVIFPKMAKDRSNRQFKNFAIIVLACIVVLFIGANIFLHPIVYFLAGKEIDLLPIRVFLLSPLFLGMGSFIGSNLIVARGYNKYMFYSILVTTSAYLLVLCFFLVTSQLNTIMAFVALTVISYLVELIYRIIIGYKIVRGEIKQNSMN